MPGEPLNRLDTPAATEGDAYGRGLAAWRLARGLRSRGFEQLAAERAGAGAFVVARLPSA